MFNSKDVDWKWFKILWSDNADEDKFYQLAQSVDPVLTFYEFDRGWAYRTVLHEDYAVAKDEFLNILNGCI